LDPLCSRVTVEASGASHKEIAASQGLRREKHQRQRPWLVDRARPRTVGMPARAARADIRRTRRPRRRRADGEDRKLLLQLPPVARGALESSGLAHEQLEVVVARLAFVFEQRHANRIIRAGCESSEEPLRAGPARYRRWAKQPASSGRNSQLVASAGPPLVPERPDIR
jgi:hypothetical protein